MKGNGLQETHDYDDIIFMPHHTSDVHPPMKPMDRAAQFAPFAALTGHGAALAETARLTCEKLDLSEDEQAVLDRKLRAAEQYAGTGTEFSFTYFVPDARKAGGAYTVCRGQIQKIDRTEKTVHLTDQTVIPIDCIADLESRVFQMTEEEQEELVCR